MRGIYRLLLATMTIVAISSSARSDDNIFGAGGLDTSFCKTPNARETVIYIDDTMMLEGKQDWATKLATKLQATLAPGEKVTVVRLSPESGQSSEMWSGCWPEYTAAQRGQIEKQTYVFSRSPLASLPEQKKFFMHDLDIALSAIYTASKRPASAARIDPQHPPEKNIIRALASDEGRFSQGHRTIRAIIYSDLAENNDLGSVFKPTTEYENYGKKLGTYLRRSVFYAYGVGDDIGGAASIIDQTRRFWLSALNSMNAAIGGIGSDLNMQNSVPIASQAFVLDLQNQGQDLEGRLSILTDADGNLLDSWIQVLRLSTSSITGTFKCQGATDDPVCKLNAKTTSGVVTESAREDLTLEGSARSKLSGEIGVKGALTYSIKAIAAED